MKSHSSLFVKCGGTVIVDIDITRYINLDGPAIEVPETDFTWKIVNTLINEGIAAQPLLNWSNLMSVVEVAHKHGMHGVLAQCSVCIQACCMAIQQQAEGAVRCTSHEPSVYIGTSKTFTRSVEDDIVMMVALFRSNLRDAGMAMMVTWLGLLKDGIPDPDKRKRYVWPEVMKAVRSQMTINPIEVGIITAELVQHHP